MTPYEQARADTERKFKDLHDKHARQIQREARYVGLALGCCAGAVASAITWLVLTFLQ